MAPLTEQTIPDGVPGPTYDRSTITAGVVHFGLGNFHRAHQARYLDQLMEQGQAREWGICGVGLLPGDAVMRDVLRAQDYLYTLVIKRYDGSWEPRVVGSIVDYLFAPDDPAAVVAALADPAIRIASLTVTEGGYNTDDATGEFDTANPQVRADAAALTAGEDARLSTVFGLIAAGLRRRRRAGVAPFTVASCDNVQGNGAVARKAIVTFARLADPDLADWIDDEVAFPNSMVDRITPATTDEDQLQFSQRYGIQDGWPVTCEPFIQWVLEDTFPLGRPAYDEVGVQLTDDVEPYELMKLRLLNASHQLLGHLGYLDGYRLVHEVAQDQQYRDFMLAYIRTEAAPSLTPAPGLGVEDYAAEMVRRFSNEYVRDTLLRLNTGASDRIPKFLLPVVRYQLAGGADRGHINHAAVVCAAWARTAGGPDRLGQPLEIVDNMRARILELGAAARNNPQTFLRNPVVFGELGDDPRFIAAFSAAYRKLETEGVRATMAAVDSLAG
ncbi:MAG: mannitol dehydrogenase family protein [Mycobacteriales bacterium]